MPLKFIPSGRGKNMLFCDGYYYHRIKFGYWRCANSHCKLIIRTTGDDETDEIESNFLDELRTKLRQRRTGRVVRMEVQKNPDPWMMRLLKIQWDIDEYNISHTPSESLIDFAGLMQIIGHKEFKGKRAQIPAPIKPLNFPELGTGDLFEILKERDILLHHPYNSMEPVLELIEKAADDPHTLSIKITIYRVAKESRITNALLRAAENGKHVSVLFEVKARFDEEWVNVAIDVTP